MRNREKLKPKGFTLLEMLVVIGLLVIVTTFAVPQFKKCFQDLHINKTLDDLESLLQSTRSYYLVMNEVPDDEEPGHVSEEVAWAMQANFLGPIGIGIKEYKGNFHYLTIKNYSGLNYDWDFWIDTDNFHPQWSLLFTKDDTNSKDLFVSKMKTRFGNSINEGTEGSRHIGEDSIILSLLEIPKENKENRYY